MAQTIRSRITRVLCVLVVSVLLLVFAICGLAQTAKLQLMQKTFDVVWKTVNDKYFDPRFGGVNWAAIRKEYEPQIATVRGDVEFRELLGRMLSEIKISHLRILDLETLDKQLARAVLTRGLALRDLDNQVVVTRTIDGSPAVTAGLRPGFVVKAIDGIPVTNARSAEAKLATDSERRRLTILDEADTTREIEIEHELPPVDKRESAPIFTGTRHVARLAGTMQAIRATANRRAVTAPLGEWISKADAKQETRHQTREHERCQETDAGSGCDDRHALADNEPEHFARCAPEREANADVFQMLLDVVRHHPVDADDSQDQSDQGKGSDQQRQRSRPLQRPCHQVVDGSDARERERRIQLADDLSDSRKDAHRIAARSHGEIPETGSAVQRRIDGPFVRLVQAGVLDIADNANDDRPRTGSAATLAQPLADCTLIRKETLRPRPIDDDGFDGRRQSVAFVEEPSFEERMTDETKVFACDRDPWRHGFGLSRWEWRHLKLEVVEARRRGERKGWRTTELPRALQALRLLRSSPARHSLGTTAAARARWSQRRHRPRTGIFTPFVGQNRQSSGRETDKP